LPPSPKRDVETQSLELAGGVLSELAEAENADRARGRVLLVVLGFLAGFTGLLFATPLVAAGLVLVRMIYVEDILGDRESGEPASFEQR